MIINEEHCEDHLELIGIAILGLLLKWVLGKFVGKAKRHLGVLQHVVKRKILDQVVCAVNLLVRVFKGGLNDKCRWVASLGGRGVVRAGVAALGLDPGDVAVLVSVSLYLSHLDRKGILTPSITVLINFVRPASTKSVMTPTASGFPASSVPCT